MIADAGCWTFDIPDAFCWGVLNHQLSSLDAKCVGVVMRRPRTPIWLPETGMLSRFMHGWKRMASYRIREWYRNAETNYFRSLKWVTDSGSPSTTHSRFTPTAKLEEKLTTFTGIQSEPASSAKQSMPWSAARWAGQHRSVGVPIDWIECEA